MTTSLFDHEKLEVYQVQLQFITWLTPLLAEVRERESRLAREVTDQLDRASLSMLLNTAEGNGKRQRRGRAKFFDDARGSAMECAACLDAVIAKGLCSPEQVKPGKVLLHRVVSMLTRLVTRFDGEGSGVGGRD
jgi:four helix bundle protein